MSLTSGPANVLPQLQVLAGFGATSASFPWTDISQYVRTGSINRPANRLAGPLYQYQAGTLTLNLKNGDARFDPDNLDGPYVTTVGLQSVTKTFTTQNLAGASNQNNQATNQVTGSVTIPTNLNGTSIQVQCWAAGGGGGSGSNISSAFGGGGGGGGEYAAEFALQVTAGNTYSFAIGLDGDGGSPGSGNGQAGGDTTFTGDSVTVHAHAGQGGTHGITTGTGGNGNQGAGGAGGTGSANTVSNPGGAGGPAGQNSKGSQASGGGGGSSGGAGGGSGFIGSGGGAVGGTGNGTGPTPGGAAVTGGGPGGTGGGPKQNGASPSGPPGGGGGGGAGDANGGSSAPGQITITYTIIVAASARTEVLPEVPIRVIGGYALNQTVNFENGLGTFSPLSSATITADSTQSLWGQSACKVVSAASAGPGINSEAIPLQGLSPWSFSAWAFCPTGYARGVNITVNWLDVNQGLISQSGSGGVPLATSTWTRITLFSQTPPSNAVYVKLQVKASGTPGAGVTFWFDQCCAAPGPAAAMFPLFTGYVDQWNDTGIMSPVDAGAPTTGPFPGYAEIQLQASDAFGIFSQVTLAQLTTPVDGGDDCGGRIAFTLSSIGWPASQQILQTSPTLCSGALFGDTILDIIQTAANTDGGDLFVDGLGNVIFNNRQNILRGANATSVQAVFGDRPGTVEPSGVELPYAGVVRANDNTTLFNDIQITPVNNSNDPFSPAGTLEEVNDPVSIAQFLITRTYQNSSLIMEFQADALNLAQLILYVAKDSEDRIDSLVIDPQRDPADLYYQALGRQFTDMVEFWRRAPGMIVPIVKRLYVRGVQHQWDFSAKTWQTTWTLQDANKYGAFIRLDDTNAGRLDYSALAY